MYIDEKYLSNSFEDPKVHFKEMLLSALHHMRMLRDPMIAECLDYYQTLETLKCLNDFCLMYMIEPIIDTTFPSNESQAFVMLEGYYTKYILTSSASDYSIHFYKTMYELTDNEFSHIQSAIDNLRKIIQNAHIDDKQKERILKKLEVMQKELHQKMSNYDKFLGGLVSLSTALGKSTKEAKPLLDYIHDVIKTILGAQQRGDNASEEILQIGVEEIIQIGPMQD